MVGRETWGLDIGTGGSEPTTLDDSNEEEEDMDGKGTLERQRNVHHIKHLHEQMKRQTVLHKGETQSEL